MEHEDSFDVQNLVSTPTDGGLPMSPPSPPHLPLLPSHMNNTDLAPSAEAVKKLQQAFELPDFTFTPTDVELVRDYLLPEIRRMLKERSPSDLYFGLAGVNAGLPYMDPWKLPGLARNKGMRDKYYLTDLRDLAFYNSRTLPDLHTTSGFWENKTSDKGIRTGHNGLVGIKRTMKFHPYRVDDALSGTKTNWIMNVHYSWNERNSFIKDGLVLCHVFETDSPDDYDTPKCLGCPPGACHGNHSGQAFGAPSNATFNSTYPGSWPMHHHDTERRSDTTLTSYIAELENLLLGDLDPDNFSGNHSGQAFGAPSNASFNSTHPGSRPMHHHDTERRSDPYIAELGNLFDPDNSRDTKSHSARRGVPPTPDHGHSKKRKKSSDVWDYFTKIFARDINGKVLTFAACNHCCKILSGSSKNGTNHLARHACPCKFKPVEAGRNAKSSSGDVNVLWF